MKWHMTALRIVHSHLCPNWNEASTTQPVDYKMGQPSCTVQPHSPSQLGRIMMMLLFSVLSANPLALSFTVLQGSLVCILQLHLGILRRCCNPHVPAVLCQPRLHLQANTIGKVRGTVVSMLSTIE